ncbi:MFS transporter, partial [Streptomyces sp. NPDC055663]
MRPATDSVADTTTDTVPDSVTDPAALPWLLAAQGEATDTDAVPEEDDRTTERPTPDGETTTPPPVPLRRNRDYRLLWGGAGLSLLAGRATAVAYPLAVLWATRSPSDAGLVGTALLLPQLVVQLPGGALVDRWD